MTRKKTFYRHIEKWSEKVSKKIFGCNGNELLIHCYLCCRFIKHRMQVKVDMPEVARNSRYIIVDFVLPRHKGQEIWIEYNGNHHYKAIYGSAKQFAKQKRRDDVERRYCEDKGIKLIELKHSMNYLKTLWTLHKALKNKNF